MGFQEKTGVEILTEKVERALANPDLPERDRVAYTETLAEYVALHKVAEDLRDMAEANRLSALLRRAIYGSESPANLIEAAAEATT